jgi:hypothetical protein
MLQHLARALGIKTRRQFRLVVRGFMVTVAASSAYGVAIFIDVHWFGVATLAFVSGLVASLVELVLGDVLAEHTYPLETEKKLRLLEERLGEAAVHAITEKLKRIIAEFKTCDENQVSGTVHILVELAPSAEDRIRRGLLQLTDYVGPNGGSKGRITTLEKGIIGRCARTAKTAYVSFADTQEYQQRMVEEFGFSRPEAERLTTVAKSYIAEPLMLGSEVMGVLYFFSTEAQVFPHAARGVPLASHAQDLVGLLKTVSII